MMSSLTFSITSNFVVHSILPPRPDQDYDRIKEQLRSCRDTITAHERRIAENESCLNRDREKFNKTADELTREINRRFQFLMSRMNPSYNGRLVRTGDAFGAYGVNLEVRFREGDPFRSLTSGYQSGTHRNNTSIIYLIG